MDSMIETDLLNQYIRAHRYGLDYTTPQSMPISPLLWISAQLLNHEFKLITAIFLLLLDRGVSLEDITLYALNRSVSLPFEGVERKGFDSMLEDMSNRGLSSSEIARIVEMSGIMVEGYVGLDILRPIMKGTEYEQTIHA